MARRRRGDHSRWPSKCGWVEIHESAPVYGPGDEIHARDHGVRGERKWAAKVLKGPVPYEVTATFEPSGGGTKMKMQVEGEPKGFFKIAEGMLGRQPEKSLEEDGERLKKILESA